MVNFKCQGPLAFCTLPEPDVGETPFNTSFCWKGKSFFCVSFFGVPLISRETEMMATSFVVPVGEVLLERVGSVPENFRKKAWLEKSSVKKEEITEHICIYYMFVYV